MPLRFVVVALVLLLFGCGPGSTSNTPSTLITPSGITANNTLVDGTSVSHLMKASGDVIVNLMDACDPETFNADPSLIGKTFFVGGTPVTLAGVAAPDFFGETVRANPAGGWLPPSAVSEA